MSKKLVSIIIPTCNRPKLLRRAVDSALRQSYNEIEVLVIDDCRDAGAEKVCREFEDARLKVYYNKRKRGACGSRNTGLELARGAYYAGLDDDDYFHRDRIQRLLDAYQPEFSFVSSNLAILNNGFSRKQFRGGRTINLPDLLWGSNCVGNQVLCEIERIRRVGGFDESLAAGQDTDLWIRLIERWGPGLRIAPCLYTVDCDHGEPRITTTVGMSKNMEYYLERHGKKMGRAQTLVTKARMNKYGNRPYLLLRAASLLYPKSWTYYLKRLVRLC